MIELHLDKHTARDLRDLTGPGHSIPGAYIGSGGLVSLTASAANEIRSLLLAFNPCPVAEPRLYRISKMLGYHTED